MAAIIEVKDVHKSFVKKNVVTKVLDGASFQIEKGEFVSLMGPSGSGKSTLLYLIGGLDRDFQGEITVCGREIGSLKEKELTRLRLEQMGFIFQFYNLVQNLSVTDNILLPMTMKGKRVSELKPKLDEILEITGLSDKKKAFPAELSGGQQQRVAIARAVLSEPELLLADEATGNLDTVSGGGIMELFKRINQEKGITILQVTHSPECAACGNRILHLENGRTVL